MIKGLGGSFDGAASGKVVARDRGVTGMTYKLSMTKEEAAQYLRDNPKIAALIKKVEQECEERRLAKLARRNVVPLPLAVNGPPGKLSEAELIRRQQIIDRVWEQNLQAKREMEEMYRGSCHRGPGDSDWNLR
jgi:hypothetical protein